MNFVYNLIFTEPAYHKKLLFLVFEVLKNVVKKYVWAHKSVKWTFSLCQSTPTATFGDRFS